MEEITLQQQAGTILITDDHKDSVDALAIMLKRAGFSVASAYSAREALDALDLDAGSGVVISDIRMPEVDGFDFLRVVKQRFPSMRVILLTGYPVTAEDVVPWGATILSKPVDFEKLQALLRQQ
jgi:DNA-binding NtrC family response regulator